MTKTTHKTFFILALLFISISTVAQKKKNKVQEKEPQAQMEEEIEIDIEVVEETSTNRSSSTNAAIEMVRNIRYNNRFEIYGSVTDDYDWYYDRFENSNRRKYGIVNKKGDVILPHLFSRGYANNNDIVLNLENNYGLFNLQTLKWDIPMEYESLNRLSNKNLFTAKKNGSYGIIDNNNAIIVPFEWSDIDHISGLDNYVIVRDHSYPSNLRGIFSVIDKKLTVPCAYNTLRKLENQNYFIVQNGSKYNIVDINNTPRFKKWYDDLTVSSRDEGYYIVKEDNRFGVIDDSEKQIVPIDLLEISSRPYGDGSHLARNKNGKYGFMLLDGRITLPFEYDNLTKKYNDNVISIQNGKCGLVQVNSGSPREIVTCDYDDIKGVKKTFIVEKNKLFGLLNEYGRPLTEIEYQALEVLNSNSGSNTIVRAKKEGYYLLLDEHGKPITSNKYIDISVVLNKSTGYYNSTNFTYLKALDKSKKYHLVDKVGKSITKPIFDDVLWENQNILIVKSKGKYGLYYILNQEQVVDFEYDQIVFTKDQYIGLKGNAVELLQVKSGQVVKIDKAK